MELSFENIAIGLDIFAGPAVVVGAVATYAKWAHKVRGRRLVQIAAIGIVCAALAADGVDRLGILWPSPSAIATARERAEKTVEQQAKRIDDLQDQVGTLTKQVEDLKAHPTVTGSVAPLTVASAKDCPPGYLIIANTEVRSFGTGVATNDKHVCIVGSALRDNKTGVELRSR
jgi:hypothetical protein